VQEHRTRRHPSIVATALFVSLLPIWASAQTVTRPAAISVTSGISTGSGETGASIGASARYDFSPRVAIEGGALFSDRGTGADAWSIDGRFTFTLVTAGRARPYASAGVGVYRASFDVDDRVWPDMDAWRDRFGQAAPVQLPAGMPANWNMGFYGMRLLERMAAAWQPMAGSGPRMHESFTDPAISVGGGVRIDLGERLVARPDARLLMVLRDGRSQQIGQFTVDLGFRF
jgi:hypothetical protein